MWLVLLSRFQSHLNIIAKFLLWIEPILRPPRGLLLITLCQATLQIPCEFKVPFQRKQRLMEDILKWSQTSVRSSWCAEERNNHLAGKLECHLHIADGLCDVLEKFASLWSNLNPMPCWIKLLAPELLYQKGKERGVPLPEIPLYIEFSMRRAVNEDGQFGCGQTFKNQFPPIRAKTHIAHGRINMLPQNQVEGFMKIYL